MFAELQAFLLVAIFRSLSSWPGCHWRSLRGRFLNISLLSISFLKQWSNFGEYGCTLHQDSKIGHQQFHQNKDQIVQKTLSGLLEQKCLVFQLPGFKCKRSLFSQLLSGWFQELVLIMWPKLCGIKTCLGGNKR